MISHVGVLPQDILDSLVATLQVDADGQPDEPQNLRFLRLPHPRTGVPSLFLPYCSSLSQRSSIAEVQTVAPHNERSWFMSEGEVVQDGKLLVLSPLDPAFLLIPMLLPLAQPDGSSGTFKPMDDIFDDITEKLSLSSSAEKHAKDSSLHISKEEILQFLSLDCARKAMSRVCEKKDITPEITVYRYSSTKVLETLRAKVARLNSATTFENSKTLIRALAKDGLMEDGKDNLLELGRLRAACDLVSQYLTPSLFKQLLASYDFTALETYMKSLEAEAAAQAAANMSKMEIKESNTSAGEKTNGKKRKTGSSAGVEKLKKANTRGMAKLSTFFQSKSAS